MDQKITVRRTGDAAEAAYRRWLRHDLQAGLEEAGYWLDGATYRQQREAVMATGMRLWRMAQRTHGPARARQWRAGKAAVGLGLQNLARILGFGALQSEALAVLSGLQGPACAEAARLGSLFNLGIVLFDLLCDGFPEERSALLETLTPEALEAVLDGSPPPEINAAMPSVSWLLDLISTFLSGTRAGAPGGAVMQGLSAAILRLYQAEVAAARAHFQDTSPNQVRSHLETKSAGPMWVMALAGLAAAGAPAIPPGIETAAINAGRLLWIVDDLCDAPEDWQDQRWSRPWLQLAEAKRLPPAGAPAEEALTGLLGSGIIEAEVEALMAGFDRLWTIAPSAAPLQTVMMGTVQSWIYGLG